MNEKTPARPDGRVATGSALAENTGEGQSRSQLQTVFTTANGKSQIVYNGDRWWTKVKLHLETAGPVAVGLVPDLAPIYGGKGQLLTTGETVEFTIAKGDTLYIAGTAVNRVKVTIEAFAWLEQITALAKGALEALRKLAGIEKR